MNDGILEMQKKIKSFNSIVGNNDSNRAKRYLSKTNWDVKKAVELFLHYHPEERPKVDSSRPISGVYNHIIQSPQNNRVNYNNLKRNEQNPHQRLYQNYNDNINLNNLLFNNNNQNKNQVTYNKIKNRLEFQISNNANDYRQAMDNNSEELKYFKQKFKYISKSLNNLISTLKSTNHGLIIIYKKENFYEIKSQIDAISKDDTFLAVSDTLPILPLLNTSSDGNILVSNLFCISLPCYLFCKYKDEKTFFIVNKIEGAFNLDNFREHLINVASDDFGEDNKIDNNYNNNNEGNDKVFYGNPYREDINKRGNYKVIKDENKMKYIGDNQQRNKNVIIEKEQNRIIPENDYDFKLEERKKNNNKFNNENMGGVKKNNVEFNNMRKNQNNKNKVKENNNIRYEENVEENYNNNNENEIKPQKEYIPDYGDYFFGDSINIESLAFLDNVNKNNLGRSKTDIYGKKNDMKKKENIPEKEKKYEPKKDNDFNVLNSIADLSDGDVLRKRENEMRELERIQEEKIKKEEEEKRKKEEEEERKIYELNKYEREIEQAANLLPEEPDDGNPNKCVILFRFPDGEKNVERKFLKTDKVKMLYLFVKSLGREIFTEEENKEFDIVQAFPPKNFEDRKNRTLEQEGLFPNSMLQIREK